MVYVEKFEIDDIVVKDGKLSCTIWQCVKRRIWDDDSAIITIEYQITNLPLISKKIAGRMVPQIDCPKGLPYGMRIQNGMNAICQSINSRIVNQTQP